MFSNMQIIGRALKTSEYDQEMSQSLANTWHPEEVQTRPSIQYLLHIVLGRCHDKYTW